MPAHFTAPMSPSSTGWLTDRRCQQNSANFHKIWRWRWQATSPWKRLLSLVRKDINKYFLNYYFQPEGAKMCKLPRNFVDTSTD